MTEKKETTNLFSSFKDVVQKVQKDVSLGIELMRLRNKLDGLRKQEEHLYSELGRNLYKSYKGKKDTAGIISEYGGQINSTEKEANGLKKKIKQLEKQTSPQAKQKAEPKATKKTPPKKEAPKEPEQGK